MDLLGGYGSESDDDEPNTGHEAAAPGSIGTAPKPTGVVPVAAPAAAARTVLFNPFADQPAQAPGMTRQQQQLPGAAKRPFTSVTGHSLPAAAGSKAKANKEAAAARPAAQRAAAALLPPQLKGRSNVVTEDIDKLFVKRSVGSSTAGAAGTASTSAAAGPGLQATPP